ncbi:MAG TPA: diacylglycerol kinase family protein [Anaerolineales bacterium]|nr:diacylglycerol kinase family protein [Anaerolineales bacterium]
MSRKVKIILNPMADMGNAWKVANDLRPILSEYGNADWSGTVYPTHATELARQAAEQGYDLVIAMGGDGTVHEVVNGLMQLPADRRPVLGIVPVGSGNDFAHAVGVPMESDHALDHALQGPPVTVDLGVMTDQHGRKEYFDNTIGIGFDTVVTIRAHKMPILRGFPMYFAAVLQTIFLNHEPIKMQIEADDKKWEQSNLMLTLCNGPREGGGFMIAPEAKVDDGLLHYAMIVNVGRLMMLRIVPEVMKGTHGKFKEVTLGSCRKMKVVADRPMYIHADGEIYTSFGSNLRELTFEVLPNALKVVRG